MTASRIEELAVPIDKQELVAERDRLLAVNAELVTALEKLIHLLAIAEVGLIADLPEIKAAKAALAKART